MMRYKVLNDFIEKKHNSTLYKSGEEYPKEEFEVDSERVAFLQTNKNKYNTTFLGKKIKKRSVKSGDE